MNKVLIKQIIKEMFLNDEIEVTIKMNNYDTKSITAEVNVLFDNELVASDSDTVYLEYM